MTMRRSSSIFTRRPIFSETDPFAVLDREGVGSLMRTAIVGGRKTRPDDQARASAANMAETRVRSSSVISSAWTM